MKFFPHLFLGGSEADTPRPSHWRGANETVFYERIYIRNGSGRVDGKNTVGNGSAVATLCSIVQSMDAFVDY